MEINSNTINNYINIIKDYNFKTGNNFKLESVEQVYNGLSDFGLHTENITIVKPNEKIIKCLNDFKNINYNNIDTLLIGEKNSKIFLLKEYFCNYLDLVCTDIRTHFFCRIQIFSWTDRVNTTISRNGDLCTRMYLSVELPPISINNKIKIKLSKKITKIIIYSEIFNIFDYFYQVEQLEELHIAYKKFNTELINLPSELKILSICSDEFNQSVDKLPTNLEYLYINSNSFDSQLDLLPPELKVLSIACTKFTNELSNLPSKLEILHISTKSNLNCSFDYLPESLKCLYVIADDIQSNLQNLPIGLEILYIETKINNVEKFNYLSKNIKQKYRIQRF